MVLLFILFCCYLCCYVIFCRIKQEDEDHQSDFVTCQVGEISDPNQQQQTLSQSKSNEASESVSALRAEVGYLKNKINYLENKISGMNSSSFQAQQDNNNFQQAVLARLDRLVSNTTRTNDAGEKKPLPNNTSNAFANNNPSNSNAFDPATSNAAGNFPASNAGNFRLVFSSFRLVFM